MKLKNVTSTNNTLGGMLIIGDPTGIEIEDSDFSGNGGHGIEVRRPTLATYFGLTGDIDPRDLVELFTAIKGRGELDRREVATKHTFIQKYGSQILNLSVFLANLTKISEANISDILQKLAHLGHGAL